MTQHLSHFSDVEAIRIDVGARRAVAIPWRLSDDLSTMIVPPEEIPEVEAGWDLYVGWVEGQGYLLWRCLRGGPDVWAFI